MQPMDPSRPEFMGDVQLILPCAQTRARTPTSLPVSPASSGCHARELGGGEEPRTERANVEGANGGEEKEVVAVTQTDSVAVGWD